MKHYLLILSLLLACANLLAEHNHTIHVRVFVPSRFKYKTYTSDGTIECWTIKPKLFTADDGVSAFWWAPDYHNRGVIAGGMVNRHWKHSLRRLR